jgi:iron transport multicopper oxidase
VIHLSDCTIREYNFNVDISNFLFQGKNTYTMMINGGKAPTIHVQRGDRLIVHLTPTSAVRGISIHWHGFEMHDKQPYDGVVGVTQCAIPSGTTFTYNFTVDEIPGTYWYHTHSHDFTYQWNDMVAGMIVVHENPVPEEAEHNPMSYENERLLMYHDMFKGYSGSRMLEAVGGLHPSISRGLAGDVVGTLLWWGALLNGAESNTNGTIVNVEPGQTYLFRILCANGLYGFNFSIPGLKLKVVATDGAPLPTPIEIDILFIYPAERFDIEVKFPISMEGQTLQIEARTHENIEQGYDHTIRGLIRVGRSAPYQLTKFIPVPKEPHVFNCYIGQIKNGKCYTFASILKHTSIPSSPDWDYSAENTIVQNVYFYFNVPPQFGHFTRQGNDPFTQHVTPHYPMIGNQYPYQLHNHSVVIDFELGKTAIIILQTNTRMHHPIHFHGMKFEVLEQYTVDQNIHCHVTACDFPDEYSEEKINFLKNMPYTGVLKDTVVLAAGGATVIRFPVNNVGAWIAHCHISLHLDDGMTFIVRQGTIEQHRNIPMPSDMPICMPLEHVEEEPACDCYFDIDSLRFVQLPSTWHCSRPYLCLHDQKVFPTPNFEPALTQGVAMHKLSHSTGTVLGVMFTLIFLIVVSIYIYKNMYKSKDTFEKKEFSDYKTIERSLFYTTFKREFITEWNSRSSDAINMMRVVEVIGLALITGVVFWHVGEETSNRGLRESVSLLFFSMTLWTFTRMYPSIPAHYDWAKRMLNRIEIPTNIQDPIVMPHFTHIIKLSLSRSPVYLCAEAWWPVIFGLIVFPIAHVNGIVSVWFQHIGFLMLNNMCYISFGAVVGILAPVIAIGMISSTLYAQTSLVCAGFYRTLPTWLAWFRYLSYVFYTFSGLVRGAYHWTDSYSCRSGDSRVGQLWCMLETAGIIEDMKLRGVSVANSSDPETNNVSLDVGMLFFFYFLNIGVLAIAFYYRVWKHCRIEQAKRDIQLKENESEPNEDIKSHETFSELIFTKIEKIFQPMSVNSNKNNKSPKVSNSNEHVHYKESEVSNPLFLQNLFSNGSTEEEQKHYELTASSH